MTSAADSSSARWRPWRAEWTATWAEGCAWSRSSEHLEGRGGLHAHGAGGGAELDGSGTAAESAGEPGSAGSGVDALQGGAEVVEHRRGDEHLGSGLVAARRAGEVGDGGGSGVEVGVGRDQGDRGDDRHDGDGHERAGRGGADAHGGDRRAEEAEPVDGAAGERGRGGLVAGEHLQEPGGRVGLGGGEGLDVGGQGRGDPRARAAGRPVLPAASAQATAEAAAYREGRPEETTATTPSGTHAEVVPSSGLSRPAGTEAVARARAACRSTQRRCSTVRSTSSIASSKPSPLSRWSSSASRCEERHSSPRQDREHPAAGADGGRRTRPAAASWAADTAARTSVSPATA